MSQIAFLSASSFPAPGTLVNLTGDVGGAVGVDAGHNINLLTGDGISSTGNPVTNTITFTLDGYTLGTSQTIGAVTADVITINLGAIPAAYIIEAKVVGFNAATPAGCGYNLICVARTTGAAATIISPQDKYISEMAGIFGADANFIVSGNTIVVRVVGVVGLTINWKTATVQMGV